MASKQDIAIIFRALRGIYGPRWATEDRELDIDYIAALWLRVLADVDDEGLKRGMAKLETSADGWPPTPGQFLALCTPTAEDLGLLSVHEAHRLACTTRADHSVPVIVWLAQQDCGPYELKHQPPHQTLPRFREIYERYVRRVLAGEAFAYPEYILRKLGPAPTSVVAVQEYRNNGLA